MKITAVSVAPIFSEYIHGGSQRIFMNVANHMSSRGHKIKVFCTKRKDNDKIFKKNNIEVHPILKFRETFPMPYMTAPYNLSEIIDLLNREVEESDLLYIHADGFHFKNFFHGKIPIVTSLHDFCYPISMISAFNAETDDIVVPSKYLRDCIESTIGPLYEDFMNIVTVIPNGIDQELFKRNHEKRKRNRENYEVGEDDKIILFPHRPDESKGIKQALDLVNFLVNKVGMHKLKLGIPRYIDLRVNDELFQFYKYVGDYAKDHGISKNIFFFEWTYPEKMPEIYEMADLTLCIGNFVESFGLVPLESLCCETPIISSKAGALRYTVKDEFGMPKIDFDDTETLKDAALKILSDNNFDFDYIRKQIKTTFSYDKMLENYESLFREAKIRPPRTYRRIRDSSQIFRLAPWCYVSSRGVYNDYEGGFIELPGKTLKALEQGKIHDLGDNMNYLIDRNILVAKY